jgi:hypothetical protein
MGAAQRLPYGIIGSLEFQYTKTMNIIVIENVNLKAYNDRLDGPDTRPFYDYSDRYVDSRYSNIHVVGHTSKGYTYDITAQLRKHFGTRFRTNLS